MELGLIVLDNKVVVSSRRVAQNYGKRHDHVLRDIRNIVKAVPAADPNFGESSYIDQTGRKLPEYIMDRQGFSMLVTGFTGAKAREFTYKYTQAFEQMAAQLQEKPKTQLEVLQQTVNHLLEHEKKLQVLEHRVNTLDGVNIQGSKRQQLNQMVKKYAWENGLSFSRAWKDFIQAFNAAYATNLKLLKTNHGGNLSTPAYLEAVNRLDDALRVADKMLNMARGA